MVTRRFRWLMVLVLVVVAILGTVPWNGRTMPFRASELRVLMCARNMAEGGNWLVPVYDREVRINKPPLMYWVVATVFRVTGGTESLAVARGVNGVLGVLLVVTIYGCGRHWVGRRRAWLAALVAGTSLLFLRFGRLCETDVALALFTMLACFSLWRAATWQGRWWWWVAAGMFSGIGFMFKGPAALILPLGALALAYVTRAAGSWKRSGAGLLLFIIPFAAVVLPWYLCLMMGRSHGAAEKDIGYEMSALLKDSPHRGPIIYYLYTLPALLMPWGLFLPPAMVQSWKRRTRGGIRFLLGWLISAMVVMTFVKSKQPHYAMLLLPPAALLTGSFLYSAMRNQRPERFKVTRGLLGLLRWAMVVGGGVLVVFPYFVDSVRGGDGLIWGVVVIVVGVVVPMVKWGSQVGRTVAALMMMSICGAAAYNAAFHECHEPAAMYRDCAAEVRNRAGDTTKVFMVGRRMMPMEFYLHRIICRPDNLAAAWKHAESGDLVIVSTDPGHQRLLTIQPTSPPVFERKQGKVELKLYVR